MPTDRAYDELIDFIAGGVTSEQVAAFEPSEQVKERELVARKKADTLSPEEESELLHFQQLEHILRMAKARARQRARQNFDTAPSTDDRL